MKTSLDREMLIGKYKLRVCELEDRSDPIWIEKEKGLRFITFGTKPGVVERGAILWLTIHDWGFGYMGFGEDLSKEVNIGLAILWLTIHGWGFGYMTFGEDLGK